MEAARHPRSAPIEGAGITYTGLLQRVSRIEAKVDELDPDSTADERPLTREEADTVLEGVRR